MKHFVNFLVIFVFLLAGFVAFETEIISFSKETYYSYKEDKTQQFEMRNYEEDLKDERYWDGKTFLLDVYAVDLGFVPSLSRLEPELQNGEKLVLWRCGKRRFLIDNDKNILIGIVGDEWGDLITKTEYIDDGFSIRFADVNIDNVDEETLVYAVSTILNLRKNDNLRDATDGSRVDIDKYYTNGQALLWGACLLFRFYMVAVRFLMSL